jgi:hypothetical protein
MLRLYSPERATKQAGLPRIRFRGEARTVGLKGRDLPAERRSTHPQPL